MSAFELLHLAIQHHIVNSLGWRVLRNLQEEAVQPILNGESALLIAPTAGGKTEAAIFPLLSRLLSENWEPISVLYVCPIKALLNNLEHRLRQYSDWLGRRVGLWHGDIGQADRRRIARAPPDILLATPESLEVMLVSRRTDHAALFANVRAVVVDEIHAFAGDDRGWHLLAVLDRISCISEHRLQRVGLSATVGNPEVLIGWLTGGSDPKGLVISPDGGDAIRSDVAVDYVGSLSNAAIIISRLHRGEKRLVFCDSRSQLESLASELRRLGVQAFVSHSSLSIDERQRAETAFSEAGNCVIVATSTLEQRGKSRWFSAGQPLTYELCQAMLRVLTGLVPDVSLSKRALSKLEVILTENEWADTESTSLVSDEKGTSWWTFGGGVLNSALASKLEERVGNVKYDNFAIHFKGRFSVEDVAESVRMLLKKGLDIAPPISEEVREEYKFGECVPGPLLDTMIALRFSCAEQWDKLRQRSVKIIHKH